MPHAGEIKMNAVFVYGTLKRGECRAALWPAEPTSIREAWVHGNLYGRGDYPAMTDGVDHVLGERWEFDESVMPCVLKRLDQIEGVGHNGEPDLYLRVTIQTWSPQGESLGEAYAYHYANDPETDGFEKVKPDRADRFVSWSS